MAGAVSEAVFTDTSCEELTLEYALALNIPAGIDDEGCTGIHLAKVVDAEAMKEIKMTDWARIIAMKVTGCNIPIMV